MNTLLSAFIGIAFAARVFQAGLKVMDIITISLWLAGFLCALNIALAIIFRKRGLQEVISYYVVIVLELAIFVFALLFRIGIITSVPYHLPPGLQFNRAEIGATIAIALGLFPAAYWHRTSLSDLNVRMAQDAKVLKERDGGVHVREHAPGEWMN